MSEDEWLLSKPLEHCTPVSKRTRKTFSIAPIIAAQNAETARVRQLMVPLQEEHAREMASLQGLNKNFVDLLQSLETPLFDALTTSPPASPSPADDNALSPIAVAPDRTPVSPTCAPPCYSTSASVEEHTLPDNLKSGLSSQPDFENRDTNDAPASVSSSAPAPAPVPTPALISCSAVLTVSTATPTIPPNVLFDQSASSATEMGLELITSSVVETIDGQEHVYCLPFFTEVTISYPWQFHCHCPFQILF